MAAVTITFRSNPDTGKPEIVVEYESEADAIAHEHERDHRAWVEKLLGAPVGDMGIVTRAKPHKEAVETPGHSGTVSGKTQNACPQ